MKTKYILSGGYAGRPNEENDKFFQEILNTKKMKLKILLVYFAKPLSEYKRVIKEDEYQFTKNKNGKELCFEIADEEKFENQAKEADVIYLHGGQTLKLLEALKSHTSLKKLFDGKIIAGESAGAYVLSSCFYSKSEGGVFKGLDYVPAKTICHYIGENSEKLNDCGEKLDLLLLPDYKYKVYYQN
ncbi:Type 1 glutamine amidotransferase-like domain-containing protein [Candidatus Parcubacteria bacterium]|nr:Type 1 glutamine amidotransferase-like domain-containing protein [Candidatus Parcubacteria bacterium]